MKFLATRVKRVVVLVSYLFEMTKADELFVLLIPEPERKCSETCEKRKRFYLLKHQICFVTSLQIIIGNPRAQMVNVMIADVSREPLHNLRQFIERTAF